MKTILAFLGTAAAVYLTVTLVPGVEITEGELGAAWITTLLVALVWSVITMVIRPVLTLLTLPITLVTFGLFAFILNAFLFWAMALVVPGFFVSGFWAALLGAVVLSIIHWLIQKIL
jgi:putative membrane protein